MLIALLIVVRAVHIAASILIAGTVTFEVIALGRSRRPVNDVLYEVERSLMRLTVWMLVAMLASALVWFWLEVVEMTGLPVMDSFSAPAWKTVLLKTVMGHVWQFRVAVGITALVLAMLALAGKPAPWRPVVLSLWFLSVMLLVSLAWISHAAATREQPIGLIGDALHLSAAGAWIGGLVPLVILLARARESPSIASIVPGALSRFSTLSLCCVTVLIASGISNSWLLVGSMHALVTSLYGWLLLFKLVLFVGLLSFGARNRLAIRAKTFTGKDRSSPVWQLQGNVITEICLGAAVVMIVACLGVTPPARHP